MSKNKLAKFAENESFPFLFQHTDYGIPEEKFPLQGMWRVDFFHNNNPIVLELGCGKGEYAVSLAERFPDKNFIGIDRKGARLWRGCKTVEKKQLKNVAFLRTHIDHIAHYFSSEEVDEIWITFPDPQPKKENHRLMSPRFVNNYYRQIVKKNALLHLKTDSRMLYSYLLETIANEHWQLNEHIENVYLSHNEILTTIQTFYEKHWLAAGDIISYIQFQL